MNEARRSRGTRFGGHDLRALSIGFVCLLSVTVVAGEGPQNSEVWPYGNRVSDWIAAHRKLKTRPVGRQISEHRRILESMGLDADHLDSERCALYVTDRLDEEEIVELSSHGITVDRASWVPPVGRHAFGYHLATVDYESLDLVVRDSRFVHLESLEFASQSSNDLAVKAILADRVHSEAVLSGLNGSGIIIAIADSGLDPFHADIPVPLEAFDVTDGNGVAEWGADVSNTVIAHGTHVTATAVGDGALSGGIYRGAAPGADLYFYKIGDDDQGYARSDDEIEAIERALAMGADVFSMSYGGTSTFMDGSGPVAQAIDAAFAAGMLSFFSAGNRAQSASHYSERIAPGSQSRTIRLTVDQEDFSTDDLEASLSLGVIWIDGVPDDSNVSLSCSNLTQGESLEVGFEGTSPRGTKARWYRLTTEIEPGSSKNYNLILANAAETGLRPRVHLFRSTTDHGRFSPADPAFTVGSPAIADRAVAVGALAHRKTWTDSSGEDWHYSDLVVGDVAPFSSRGPRIDGRLKPDLVAPGAATISARDSGTHIESGEPLAGESSQVIDNNGQRGVGPSDYYVMRGTSMASPMAAGVAALVIQANPQLSPGGVLEAMSRTASSAAAPNVESGSGLIDAMAAVNRATTIRADFDESLRIDGFDLARLARAFGAAGGEAGFDSAADLDASGMVDGNDLAILASLFGDVLSES